VKIVDQQTFGHLCLSLLLQLSKWLSWLYRTLGRTALRLTGRVNILRAATNSVFSHQRVRQLIPREA